MKRIRPKQRKELERILEHQGIKEALPLYLKKLQRREK